MINLTIAKTLSVAARYGRCGDRITTHFLHGMSPLLGVSTAARHVKMPVGFYRLDCEDNFNSDKFRTHVCSVIPPG
jgi:hypothetical protein